MNQLPPFSPTLNKLLSLLAKEDVFYADLSAVIEKDTVLAGNVLRLVNSALYARSGTVNSVRHAVSVIGMNKLRNLALSMSVSKLWKQIKTPPSWSQAAFNQHSLATAVMVDLMAQRVTVRYPEGGFIAGLLHAMGKLMVATGLPDQYDAILKLHENSPSLSMEQAEFQVIGCCHAELCAAALSQWKLPTDIQEAVGHQHDPRPDSGNVMDLSRLLAEAHRVVNLVGVTIPSCAGSHNAPPEDALAKNGIVGAEAKKLLEEFQAEFGAMKSFFA